MAGETATGGYGTVKLAEKFAARVLTHFYETAVTPFITNQDFEGDIKDQASILNILAFDKVKMRTYTGADMTDPDDIYEKNAQLVTDQMKSYYFKIKSIQKFKSWIKNPQSKIITQLGGELAELVDAYNLGLYTDVAAGNRYGTDYKGETNGSVAITATTGAVVGTNTTFTEAMVGRPFKAAGHTSWYRVKTFTDATHITIEDDKDDVASAYTGGTIAGGATFVIQAATAVQMTSSTCLNQLLALKTKLDKMKVPRTPGSRYFVAPSDICNIMPLDTRISVTLADVYKERIENGYVGRLAGFDIYSNEQVAGDADNGYHCLAGHTDGIVHAMGWVETGLEEDLKGNFGKAYKGLDIYGSKVPDIRRILLAEGYFKP